MKRSPDRRGRQVRLRLLSISLLAVVLGALTTRAAPERARRADRRRGEDQDGRARPGDRVRAIRAGALPAGRPRPPAWRWLPALLRSRRGARPLPAGALALAGGTRRRLRHADRVRRPLLAQRRLVQRPSAHAPPLPGRAPPGDDTVGRLCRRGGLPARHACSACGPGSEDRGRRDEPSVRALQVLPLRGGLRDARPQAGAARRGGLDAAPADAVARASPGAGPGRPGRLPRPARADRSRAAAPRTEDRPRAARPVGIRDAAPVAHAIQTAIE